MINALLAAVIIFAAIVIIHVLYVEPGMSSNKADAKEKRIEKDYTNEYREELKNLCKERIATLNKEIDDTWTSTYRLEYYGEELSKICKTFNGQ